MSSLKSFVILNEEDEENFDGVSDLALTLDRRDFSVDGYPVDSKKYPLIRKALLRGKEKAALVEEDEEDIEDIRAMGGTPSSSTRTWSRTIRSMMLFLLDRLASATL